MANTTTNTNATVNTTTSAAKKKPTKKELWKMILALKEVQANPTLKEFGEHELELLDKKSASKKASANKAENEELRDVILELLESFPDGATITQMQNASADLEGLSNQKMSSLLSPLCKNGIVIREINKKITTFKLA